MYDDHIKTGATWSRLTKGWQQLTPKHMSTAWSQNIHFHQLRIIGPWYLPWDCQVKTKTNELPMWKSLETKESWFLVTVHIPISVVITYQMQASDTLHIPQISFSSLVNLLFKKGAVLFKLIWTSRNSDSFMYKVA